MKHTLRFLDFQLLLLGVQLGLLGGLCTRHLGLLRLNLGQFRLVFGLVLSCQLLANRLLDVSSLHTTTTSHR